MAYEVPPFTFDFLDGHIHVAPSYGVPNVACIDLYNAIKEARASSEGILYDIIAEGSGLIELEPGISTALNVQLTDYWRLAFPESGEYQVTVYGGNLTGGVNGNPIEYTPNVQVKLILANAATVVSVGSAVLPQDVVDIKNAVLDDPLEGTLSLKKILRLLLSAITGKSSGASTSTIKFRDVADTKDRIVGAVTEQGDRTGITLDPD